MEFGNKMMVVPVDQSVNPLGKENVGASPINKVQGDTKKIRKDNIIRIPAAERMRKVLKIILALAKIGGYDDEGRIKSGSSFLENSDIVSLINNVISPRKILIGEAEFVQLLHEANIDPNLITNESVKYRLINSKNDLKKLSLMRESRLLQLPRKV